MVNQSQPNNHNNDDLLLTNVGEGQLSFPEAEESVLRFWDSIDAFKTSSDLNKNGPIYSFYDGPPFATGLPHYGHILAGTIKDIITRYASLNGYNVDRRFGWDCHGLPVEYEIDKTLGIKGREDVFKIGVDKYNEHCRSIVMRYSKEWEVVVKRCGRWIDFDNGYKTMDMNFMESVWYVFKQLYEKNMVYRGFKVMPYSTACNTPLSNFEATQNYKDVNDPSVVVSFPIINDQNKIKALGEEMKNEEISMLAWTTTPWTLPSNLALCVNPEYEYVVIEDKKHTRKYLLMEKLLGILYKDPAKDKKAGNYVVIKSIKGSHLCGVKYKPLFDYFYSEFAENGFKVLCDSYVTDDSGTGIVHQAPAFGEDDYRICSANLVIKEDGTNLPCPVDDKGCLTEKLEDFKGMYFKDADKHIIKKLKDSGRLITQSQCNHSYPFCWRSDTPLMYKAVPSWFVRVKDIIPDLLKCNEETYWVPEYVKEKRFANWIANARDWNISRNRYWGTPIPLWVSDDFSEVRCIGSVQELKELSGEVEINDIHKHKIDHIKIKNSKGTGYLKRIDEVFDCWFESGSMPYAQQHYPFENQQKFKNSFPANFIAEGLDQTRGWFYTLMVLSTHLHKSPPFKNLIVNGLILASDGKKMSKRLKNYPDPNFILNQYGADSLRLYMINSPVVRAEPLRFKESGVKDVVAKVLIPWYNSFKFFKTQVAQYEKTYNERFIHSIDFLDSSRSKNIMDSWILARCQSLIQFIKQEMEAYRLYTVVPRLLKLIDELTNWYIRFNRKRLKDAFGKESYFLALNALYKTLFTLCCAMASFTPFITETIYQGLKEYMKFDGEPDTRSVHFLTFPKVSQSMVNPEIERKVEIMQSIIEIGRFIREKNSISLKAPLREIVVIHENIQYREDMKLFEAYIKEELNVKSVVITNDEGKYGVKYKIQADYKSLGTRLKRDLPFVKDALSKLSSSEVKEFISKGVIVLKNHELKINTDLQTHKYFDSSSNSQLGSEYSTHSDKDMLVLLNTSTDSDLVEEAFIREMLNRIQRLRKKALLKPQDEVNMFYDMEKDPSNQLASALNHRMEMIVDHLKRPLQPYTQKSHDASVIVEENNEINGSTFKLCLTRPE